MNYFPQLTSHNDSQESTTNPALILFGERLFSDQSPMELWYEFLLVCSSPKSLNKNTTIDEYFPPITLVKNWKDIKLTYFPKKRLNLKLFSFLNRTAIADRHISHIDQFQLLKQKLDQSFDGPSRTASIIKLLESFQSIGISRGWWAIGFLPICDNFLARETLWYKSKFKNISATWDQIAINGHNQFYHADKRNFLARGGEHLYLQICCLLKQDASIIHEWQNNATWLSKYGKSLEYTEKECKPSHIRDRLTSAIKNVLDSKLSKQLSSITRFIDEELEKETSKHIDNQINGITAKWVPSDSWKSGLLLAWDIIRILESRVDVVKKTHLLALLCALHSVRFILTECGKQSFLEKPEHGEYEGVPYRLVFTHKDANVDDQVRNLSIRNLNYLKRGIKRILDKKNKDLIEQYERTKGATMNKIHSQYGYGLLKRYFKALGIMIPIYGGNERLIFSDLLAQLMVITLVPGDKGKESRMTYDTFKELMALRYGFVVDADGIEKAYSWMAPREDIRVQDTCDLWFLDQLERLGCLEMLSDSCSLIVNKMN